MENRKIKTKLIGREEVFKTLALGETLQLPVLLLGQPGVGKTQALLDYAASKYNYNREQVRENTFIIELDEGTKTSEIKGRVNMKQLLEDKEYKIDAPIADAEFVMINEVDKGNSAIRNTMLSVMREKAIFYGDEIKKCKWKVFTGSCNQITGSEFDNPFWDRFVLTSNIDRIGADMILKTFKGTINVFDVSIPSSEEVSETDLDKTMINKFIKAIYDVISDRTASYLPKVVKAIKLIYNIEDLEAIMKCCELVAPSRVSVVSSKLESTKENSVRTQIENLKGVFDGGDNIYTRVYFKSLCSDLSEMVGIKTYVNKVKELEESLQETINNLNYGYDNDDVKDEFLRLVDSAMTQTGQFAVKVDTEEEVEYEEI
tara:strand:- start:1099 stop:2217 length:1119 start_codon:yes stop_codon:yes gene_type:complete